MFPSCGPLPLSGNLSTSPSRVNPIVSNSTVETRGPFRLKFTDRGQYPEAKKKAIAGLKTGVYSALPNVLR